MHGFHHTTNAVQMLIAQTKHHPITGNQATHGTAQIAAMHHTGLIFHIGVLAKTADDQTFLRCAQQAFINLRRLFFQATGLVGIDSALLTLG